MLPLETVPNFSEGRDGAVVDALGQALETAGARVLDLHVDADHHRSVFTACGAADALHDGLVAAARVAVEQIDLRRHEGVHPRVGAVDVMPIVALDERRTAEAHALVERLAVALAGIGLAPLLYADSGEGRRPHDFRGEGLEGLADRLAAGTLTAAGGATALHPSAGAVILGVRPPLLAYNVDLDTDRLAVARAAAAAVRERDGGFEGVRALGLALPRRGIVQVSMNLERPEVTPLPWVVERIRQVAAAHGASIRGGELIGLMPAEAAAAAAGHYLQLPAFHAGQVLEVAIQRAGL
jgi:glutamate formiminotransferase